jgi:hypothetical protein
MIGASGDEAPLVKAEEIIRNDAEASVIVSRF